MYRFVCIIGLTLCLLSQLLASDELDSLKTLLSAEVDDTLRIRLLLDIASITADDPSMLDSTLTYTDRAMYLANEISYAPGAARVAYQRGYAYDVAGRIEEALLNYRESSERYKELGDHEQVATSLNGLGVACYFNGDYGKALEFYLEALAYAEAHDLIAEAANTQLNIGVIYRITGKNQKAIDIYQENVRIRKKMKDSIVLVKAYNNLAVAYTYVEDFEKAALYADSSIAICEAIKDSLVPSWRWMSPRLTYKMPS